MSKTRLLYQGIAELVLLQIPMIIWGIDAILEEQIVAISYSLLLLAAVLTIVAGSGIEVGSLRYNQVAGAGQVMNAVGLLGLIVAVRIWESHHSVLPTPVFVIGITLAVAIWLLIGIDMIAGSGYIVDPEQYTDT